jgi:hypothetical protein
MKLTPRGDGRRPVFLLLTGDFALAARLQGRFAARLGARLLWCASLRDVRANLDLETPVALLVEVSRRSRRMLQVLGALAERHPILAITRPDDDLLRQRCLAAGARFAMPRLDANEERLMDVAAGLLSSPDPCCPI